jgi:hypothetical protein
MTGVCSLIVLKQGKWLKPTVARYTEVSLQAFEMNGVEFNASFETKARCFYSHIFNV